MHSESINTISLHWGHYSTAGIMQDDGLVASVSEGGWSGARALGNWSILAHSSDPKIV